MVVVRSNASLCTSVDIVTGKGEMTRALKDEETRGLNKRRKVEDKIADLALGGVRVELEIEDCAFIFGSYGRPFRGWVCFVGVLGRYGDEY